MSHLNTLFHPVDLGANLTLKNRIIMAPLTRSMADNDLVPTEAMAASYGRRADAGLIITEATLVSQDGQGYPNGPGLYTQAQIDGWKNVTQRVHQNGGKIFAQIWHTGRVSHSIYHNGELPMAPSAVPILGHGHVPLTENLSYETPREITVAEIKRVQNQFAVAAQNAIEAGFDGIEIHGANSYLIDEFLHWDTNRREDEYGGTVENMARFLFEVIDQIKAVIPEGKIGVRLSPQAYINLEHDERDKQVFDYLLPLLNRYDLAYVHTGMFSDEPFEHLNGTVTQYIRKHYRGTVIASGGYTAKSGAAAIERGDADLIAIGRAFIANPDYVEKVKQEKALVEYSNTMLSELI
jgi:2,4-dienoyl-CoA reductase-like NADH-dependent reductase (Old Yellow Enzyme family)